MYTYRATEKNNNFICSDSDGIGIGCGDKNFGLYISKSLANGESDSSDTFDNDRLSESQYFKIKKIEVIIVYFIIRFGQYLYIDTFNIGYIGIYIVF